jgi:NADPH:quinone reductase
MRVALAPELNGIDSVQLGEQPDPAREAGQVLIRVHCAGVGPWDVGFVGGGFPGLTLPFVPGQEIAGVVEAADGGADVLPARRSTRACFQRAAGSPNWRSHQPTAWPSCRSG